MGSTILLIIAAVAISAVLVAAFLRLGANLKQSEQSLAAAQGELRAAEKRIADLTSENSRFRPIIDIETRSRELQAVFDAQRALLEKELADLRGETERQVAELQTAAQADLALARAESEKLRNQYAEASRRYQNLTAEISGLEENLENISVGLYKPHFTYADYESYKQAIEQVRDQMKWFVKSGTAATCTQTWLVGESRAEGERMTKQYLKLMLRAFNAEADAAIANVTWNNFNVMRNRIHKAFEAINKFGTVMQMQITDGYLNLRVHELTLVYDAAEFRQREREEERRARAAQREEEKVQRELERAREEAAKDELKYQRALAKARLEAERALGAEREVMLVRIRELEADLAEAHERKERAIAQAQLTRVGHVYIISNVGAFGDGVIKIGLTRRLEPEERIKELGDASVPFPFDLHALIYSEDAPDLESKLHNRFWDRRLNWANDRKEFFRISLDELHGALQELGLPTQIHRLVEAREWRETLVLLDSQRSSSEGTSVTDFRQPKVELPADPFTGIDKPLPPVPTASA